MVRRREEAMGTATLVKRLTGFMGDAALYRLDPPLGHIDWRWDDEANESRDVEFTSEFVIVSATVVPYSGPETYIFPGSPEGEVTDWGELPGSFRGALDHAAALRGAGYDIA
jgi:hypothetical protein